MKIVLASQEYPPETGWGGIGTYAGIIAPALARCGVEVHVLSVVADQEPSDVERDGVVIHRRRLKRPRGVGRITRMPASYERAVVGVGVSRELGRLDVDPDVVEYPEWMAEGLLAAVTRRRPMVVRLHSSAAQVFPFLGPVGRDQRLSIAVENRVIRRADVVTGTRPQILDARQKLGLAEDRSFIINYPVRPAPITPVPSCSRVAFAGRLEHRKGPETIVAALGRVVAEIPEAEIVLVGRDTSDPGRPSVAAHLREIAASGGVADSLHIVERWGSDAVAEEFTAAAVVAVPSRWESFGYVAAEAAALGRPVAASDIPSLRELVDDPSTGRLIDPEDPSAWADALVAMLSDRDRLAAMGEAAARRMAEICDPTAMAELTIEAYERAIAHRRRR